jgi:AAA15 family ATPase/GTPase
MIDRAELKNFGPIKELDWQNLGKINLIIGNNGCGKSFLLKALYSAVRTLEEYKRGETLETDSEILANKLHWTFQAEKIGDLVNKKANTPLSFKLFFNETLFEYSFGKDTVKDISNLKNTVTPRADNSIYLPAKEVLSLFNIIFDSRKNKKSFGFDDTYLDLVVALFKQHEGKSFLNNINEEQQQIRQILKMLENHKEIKGFREDLSNELKEQIKELDKKKQELIKNKPIESSSIFYQCQEKLDNMLGGKIEYDYGVNRWYFKQGNQKFSVGVIAEGIKKIAILDTLLSNSYLSENSIVFIDEPESALHPQAISQLLDIIAALANHGIQFFLASHSYFVIKKLFLIAQEQQMPIPVLSYQNNEWVQSDLKDDLPDNPIIDESIRLYEQQLDMD